MRKTLPLFSLTLLTAVLLVVSCQKPNNPAPQKFTGCRVTRITEAGYDTSTKDFYYFYYNDDGTLQRIVSFPSREPLNGTIRYFSYSANFTRVREVYAQQDYTIAVDSITLDGQNRVAGVYHLNGTYYYYYPANGLWQTYHYDSAGEVESQDKHWTTNDTTVTFTWLNGDIQQYTSNPGAGTYIFTYSDTVYRTGNTSASLFDLEHYGRSVMQSQHLCTSSYQVGYSPVLRYTYELDAYGNITYIRVRPDGVGGVSYYRDSRVTYACQ